MINLLLLLCFSCAGEEIPPDNGRWILPNGEEATPLEYPWTITSTLEIEGEVLEALDWWNLKGDFDGKGRILFTYSEEEYPAWTDKVVSAAQEEIPQEERAGSFSCLYQERTFTSCQVLVSPKYSNSLTIREILKHELGHTLGLDDDLFLPKRPSIMSSPIFLRSPVTEYDLFLVVTDYDRR